MIGDASTDGVGRAVGVDVQSLYRKDVGVQLKKLPGEETSEDSQGGPCCSSHSTTLHASVFKLCGNSVDLQALFTAVVTDQVAHRTGVISLEMLRTSVAAPMLRSQRGAYVRN